MNQTNSNEYESFVAEYYDFNPICAGRKDVDFYVDLARAAGGPILELGCGTGRILLPIARAGCRIVGLDLAELMLAKCREKLAREPREVRERVRLVPASMADFDLGETFRLVTTPFRSFQHLRSVDEQLACLRAAHRHLVPGGRLVLDLFQTNARMMHDPVFTQESDAGPGRVTRRAQVAFDATHRRFPPRRAGQRCRVDLQDHSSRRAEDRKSTRLNSSHIQKSRMPSSA